jgi:hypothetical protein
LRGNGGGVWVVYREPNPDVGGQSINCTLLPTAGLLNSCHTSPLPSPSGQGYAQQQWQWVGGCTSGPQQSATQSSKGPCRAAARSCAQCVWSGAVLRSRNGELCCSCCGCGLRTQSSSPPCYQHWNPSPPPPLEVLSTMFACSGICPNVVVLAESADRILPLAKSALSFVCSAFISPNPTQPGHCLVGFYFLAKKCGTPSVSYPPTAIQCPPTAIGYSPTAVNYPPTAGGFPPTTARCSATAV